jgi:hypothetical protein
VAQSGLPQEDLTEIPVDQACDWDEDAIAVAIESAQSMMEFDPDGARQLLAQAQAAERKRGKTTRLSGREPYDPMRLYARMKKYYGMSHAEMDSMHFATFFGYVREAQIMIDEEKAEYDKARAGNTTQAIGGLGDFPQARPYEGETVPI